MQQKRGSLTLDQVDAAQDTFTRLIDGIATSGFDMCSVLKVDNRQQLLDGSHRLATALYFKEKFVPLLISRFKRDVDYGIGWFINNDFTQDEIELIENKLTQILVDNYMYFQVMLWPPVEPYFDEIETLITKDYKMLNSYTLDLGDDFRDFVFGIYASDDIADWKIEKKLSGFSDYGTKVKILEIEIPEPRFRKKAMNNHDISQEVESLKKNIREMYKLKVKDYFYDIIMHVGDNYDHTRMIDEVIKRYTGE